MTSLKVILNELEISGDKYHQIKTFKFLCINLPGNLNIQLQTLLIKNVVLPSSKLLGTFTFFTISNNDYSEKNIYTLTSLNTGTFQNFLLLNNDVRTIFPYSNVTIKFKLTKKSLSDSKFICEFSNEFDLSKSFCDLSLSNLESKFLH
jgi:hypothetical protein